MLRKLVEKDLGQGIWEDIATTHRAYHDTENHVWMWPRNIHSAILLKGIRTERKDKNKEVWLALRETSEQAGEEGAIQGRWRVWRGQDATRVGRCRYLGRVGFAARAFMTAIVLNLKRTVGLLAGHRFGEGPGCGCRLRGEVRLERAGALGAASRPTSGSANPAD